MPPSVEEQPISVIRGALISAAIAIRAHLREIARPTRTRDATEVINTCLTRDRKNSDLRRGHGYRGGGRLAGDIRPGPRLAIP